MIKANFCIFSFNGNLNIGAKKGNFIKLKYQIVFIFIYIKISFFLLKLPPNTFLFTLVSELMTIILKPKPSKKVSKWSVAAMDIILIGYSTNCSCTLIKCYSLLAKIHPLYHSLSYWMNKLTNK